jgi:hypothetical protein
VKCGDPMAGKNLEIKKLLDSWPGRQQNADLIQYEVVNSGEIRRYMSPPGPNPSAVTGWGLAPPPRAIPPDSAGRKSTEDKLQGVPLGRHPSAYELPLSFLGLKARPALRRHPRRRGQKKEPAVRPTLQEPERRFRHLKWFSTAPPYRQISDTSATGGNCSPEMLRKTS